jgi:hypothetical protein
MENTKENSTEKMENTNNNKPVKKGNKALKKSTEKSTENNETEKTTEKTTNNNETETDKTKIKKKINKKRDDDKEIVPEIIKKEIIPEEIQNDIQNDIQEEIQDDIQDDVLEDIFKEDVKEEDILEEDNKEKKNKKEIKIISMDEYNKILNEIHEKMLYLSDINLKNIPLITKEDMNTIITINNKILKSNVFIQTNITNFMIKEISPLLKKKEIKSNKVKELKDPKDHVVNKKIKSYCEVLKFLKPLSIENLLIHDETDVENELVSRADIQRGISAFQKNEKQKGNTNIDYVFTNENGKTVRGFHLIGELKDLFDFIKIKMIERNDLPDESKFPKSLLWTQLNSYTKYCFPIQEKI